MLHTGPPRRAAARAPVPREGHFWPLPPQESLKHSKAGLAQSLMGPGVHTILLAPSECLWQVWDLILNAIVPPLPSCWGFSFASYINIYHTDYFKKNVLTYPLLHFFLPCTLLLICVILSILDDLIFFS